MKNRMLTILSTSDATQQRFQPASILSHLFRTMLLDLHITGLRFIELMHGYLRRHCGYTNMRKAQPALTAFRNELAKDTMSVSTFVKAMQLLRMKNITITVEAEDEDGKKTTHSTHVVLSETE